MRGGRREAGYSIAALARARAIWAFGSGTPCTFHSARECRRTAAYALLPHRRVLERALKHGCSCDAWEPDTRVRFLMRDKLWSWAAGARDEHTECRSHSTVFEPSSRENLSSVSKHD